AHEYCTPATRNISQGDDPNDLPFIPFADDPSFDHASYLHAFARYSWERPVADPDVEVVVVEAARRLRTEHQMLYEHIDETGVLPLELLNRVGSRGMIDRSQRRDFPDWPPGVPASAKHLKHDTEPIPTSPENLIALEVSTFCSNLNCIVPFCATHSVESTPMPLKVLPNIKNQRMKEHVRTACGLNCFLLKSADDDDPIHWPDSETEFLRMVLDYSPDARPCDLSTVCSRPCYEVFEFRKTMLPDSIRERKKSKPQPKLGRSAFDDASRARGEPCRHEGPCSAATECACYLNKAHCESGCRCSRKCARRWRGCACSTPKRGGTATICRTERCACYLAHRECDPEICLKCQAKYAYLYLFPQIIFSLITANLCKNADIQRAKWKKTKVAPGRWGMGLFIAESAVANDLIIEYVGELIYDLTTESRQPVADHRGRNYLFELNASLSVDGTYVGNDARYINHDARNPNCGAKVRMVNGEHRIGIYATRPLKPGEEVLFNYGDHFFQSKGDGGQSGSKTGPSK
ncbi:hypothetical protein B0H16DRAFT_1850398, partial [Mycena metata]